MESESSCSCNCMRIRSDVSGLYRFDIFRAMTSITDSLAKVPSLLVVPPTLRDSSLQGDIRELGVSSH